MPITNLAWLPGSLLLVSNGVQALVLSRDLSLRGHSSNLSDIIQAAQAPLPDAHPENLVQCVIWGKLPPTPVVTGHLADLFAGFPDKFHIVKKQLRRISAALQENTSGQAADLSEIDVDAFMGCSESIAEENVTVSPWIAGALV